ncbi:hypothetical protein RUM43_003265 [Polyplax serrata]|uniref:Uncharacterized protein n=1 Tax=Polyplax serrata TaxID=468196 RepID=A0AAN8Q0H0_POLSC
MNQVPEEHREAINVHMLLHKVPGKFKKDNRDPSNRPVVKVPSTMILLRHQFLLNNKANKKLWPVDTQGNTYEVTTGTGDGSEPLTKLTILHECQQDDKMSSITLDVLDNS